MGLPCLPGVVGFELELPSDSLGLLRSSELFLLSFSSFLLAGFLGAPGGLIGAAEEEAAACSACNDICIAIAICSSSDIEAKSVMEGTG